MFQNSPAPVSLPLPHSGVRGRVPGLKSSGLLRALAPGAVLSLGVRPPLSAQDPLFEGLGAHRWTVTTDSAKAQRYFSAPLDRAYAEDMHGV